MTKLSILLKLPCGGEMQKKTVRMLAEQGRVQITIRTVYDFHSVFII